MSEISNLCQVKETCISKCILYASIYMKFKQIELINGDRS